MLFLLLLFLDINPTTQSIHPLHSLCNHFGGGVALLIKLIFGPPQLQKKEMKLYKIFSLQLSSIGGTLGIFCGVSLISLLELFYYLIGILRNVFVNLLKRDVIRISIQK